MSSIFSDNKGRDRSSLEVSSKSLIDEASYLVKRLDETLNSRGPNHLSPDSSHLIAAVKDCGAEINNLQGNMQPDSGPSIV